MSRRKRGDTKNLDKELSELRNLIEKENEMLRQMIDSLDSLEERMMGSRKKESEKRKKSPNTS
jgi:hypothetical protein